MEAHWYFSGGVRHEISPQFGTFKAKVLRMRELMIGIICAVKLMARVPCCPICYSLIREPVVFPCHHEVCRDCFDHSLKTANFCCPLCRKRVSSWARRHAKDPVDHRRKRELEERFQKLQEDTTLYSATGKRADFLRALPYLQPKYVCT